MFVVFEGIDGSGKTTVSSRVAKQLRDGGLAVEHLREGGKFTSAVTQAIREFGRDARHWELKPEAEFLLYVTRDLQLIEERTRPALARADVVIADRFLYSAENLARSGRGLAEAFVRPVLEAAARDLVPDLVVWIDLDPHVARARRQVEKRNARVKRPPSRKGLWGVGLQHRLRTGYAAMTAREPERWVQVGNDFELAVTVDAIAGLIRGAVRGGVSSALDGFRRTAAAEAAPSALGSPEEALLAFLRFIDDRAKREPAVAAYFLSGLYGSEVDVRRRALADTVPEAVVAAAIGLDDALSWEFRQRFALAYPACTARSLRGFAAGHPQASGLRAALQVCAPLDVLDSYDTIDDAPAFHLRDALYAEHPAYVMGSLTRLDTPRAWALRERFLAEFGERAFAEYEVAQQVCKSVAWLDDERAWALREAAREVAPVAALGSIAGCMNSERAWRWRERFVERAPKVVFATLRHNQDARGWPMRERFAPLCKEAIDSIADLADEPAWRLREVCADIWPSTVLKSLGPLCESPRGIHLIGSLLERHSANVSLLKHASAIALGLHRRHRDANE